jgi:hypothetical protein
MSACSRCGAQWVGSANRAAPPCPRCKKPLSLLTGRLPITLSCSGCEGRYYYFDPDSQELYLREHDPFPLGPPLQCSACQRGLIAFENLPPRAVCPTCDRHFLVDPLRAVPACEHCGGDREVVAGRMPVELCCRRCGRSGAWEPAGRSPSRRLVWGLVILLAMLGAIVLAVAGMR